MLRDNRTMGLERDSKRRRALALQNQQPAEQELLIRPPGDVAGEPRGQYALALPAEEPPSADAMAAFFEACGGTQTISLSSRRLVNAAPADRHLFRKPFFVIGRSANCDLVIPDPTASFRHIYVQLISGRWFFLNLAKISGTMSGKGQPESGWFDVGCQLNVGSYVLTRVEMGRPATGRAITVSEAQPTADLPHFTLEIINGKADSREPPSIQFCAPITLIGASPQCELFLNDGSVSKVHACLVLTTHGMWVIDLLGRGGVLVDGRPAEWKQVHDGTILQIGRFQLRIRFDNSHFSPSVRIENRAVSGEVPLAFPGTVSGGSLSEGAVLTLIEQLAEMQNQFFEQSRLQMQWMSEMIAHVGRAQQESARQDIARIEEITQELREIKSQLATGVSHIPSSTNGERNHDAGQHSAEEVGISKGQARLPSLMPTRYPNAFESEPITNSQGAKSPPSPQPLAEPIEEPLSDSTAKPIVPEIPPPVPQQSREPIPECVPNPSEPPAAGVFQPAPQASVSDRTQPALSGASPVDAHAWLTQRMAALSHEQTSVWRRLMNTLAGRPNA